MNASADQWCDWAQAEHRGGRAERAAEGFRRALTLDPASFAAGFGLASVLLDGGDVDGAAAVVGTLSAAASERPEVLWLAARLAAAQGETATAHDLLQRLVRYPQLSFEQRAEALLLLGLVLGDLHDDAEAFAVALMGKALQRDLHRVQARSREGEVAKLQRLTAWIAAEPGDWRSPLIAPAADAAAASHVFLLGFPRSGTTLLETVLAGHPRVATLEEAPTLATAYQAFLSDAGVCADLMRLQADEAEAWVDHYWRGVRQRGIDVAGKLFVDKQPAGTLYLPLIPRLFPRAKILFALRDPRDVVLSCFRQAFQINAMTYTFTDLEQTAACYDACMTLADQARARLPLAWLDVRHEALVEDFAGELGRVVEFLALEPHPAMADFARRAAERTIRTPSATQVRAGLNRRGLARWEQYRTELAPVLLTLAPWVERFGYA
ncbi:tetratricopeptide repeat-containing sulfotransferase family protein [Sphingomonas bacterium]|uniref:tetratricopeptide repeat-containing sulfotransferase family protein n=1 Tax=Sphingomonas bacterium TaxID=1895847 RepID=UPI001575C278|nr:sulfotransferase [Sphingomonas bacterium]